MPAHAELCDALISEVHAAKVARHFGVHKTRAVVLRRFWWPSRHGDVERYVKEC